MTMGRDTDKAGAISRDRFDIRLYRHGDEGKITEMFNEVFSQHRQLDHWYWKYRDNPYGSYYISLAVADDGKPAAHYGGYPVRIFTSVLPALGLHGFKTLQLGDKMTRKQFRSCGVGRTSLLARTFALFRRVFVDELGIPFVYGFTTHHSKRLGLLFFNYADVEPVPYRRLCLETPWKKPGLVKRLFLPAVEEVSGIDDTWTDFFKRVAPSYECLVERDAGYLQWRYLKRPDKKYFMIRVRRGSKLAGWSVFYREGDRIIWGDALFNHGDADSVKSVLIYLRAHPVAAGAKFIVCWFPPRPAWWNEILQDIGFKREVEPNKLHFTILPDSEIKEDLKKYFYYTMGDSDLF
jgi:hypothetical protein